jgi:hypothetical protein
MGVQLASRVVRSESHAGLVDQAHDLDIRGRASELHAQEGTLANDARPVAFLGAIGHSLALDVGDYPVVDR